MVQCNGFDDACHGTQQQGIENTRSRDLCPIYSRWSYAVAFLAQQQGPQNGRGNYRYRFARANSTHSRQCARPPSLTNGDSKMLCAASLAALEAATPTEKRPLPPCDEVASTASSPSSSLSSSDAPSSTITSSTTVADVPSYRANLFVKVLQVCVYVFYVYVCPFPSVFFSLNQ